jgi:hypothetical protein
MAKMVRTAGTKLGVLLCISCLAILLFQFPVMASNPQSIEKFVCADTDVEDTVPDKVPSSGPSSMGEEEADDDDTTSRGPASDSHYHFQPTNQLLSGDYSFAYTNLNMEVTTPPPRSI